MPGEGQNRRQARGVRSWAKNHQAKQIKREAAEVQITAAIRKIYLEEASLCDPTFEYESSQGLLCCCMEMLLILEGHLQNLDATSDLKVNTAVKNAAKAVSDLRQALDDRKIHFRDGPLSDEMANQGSRALLMSTWLSSELNLAGIPSYDTVGKALKRYRKTLAQKLGKFTLEHNNSRYIPSVPHATNIIIIKNEKPIIEESAEVWHYIKEATTTRQNARNARILAYKSNCLVEYDKFSKLSAYLEREHRKCREMREYKDFVEEWLKNHQKDMLMVPGIIAMATFGPAGHHRVPRFLCICRFGEKHIILGAGLVNDTRYYKTVFPHESCAEALSWLAVASRRAKNVVLHGAVFPRAQQVIPDLSDPAHNSMRATIRPVDFAVLG